MRGGSTGPLLFLGSNYKAYNVGINIFMEVKSMRVFKVIVKVMTVIMAIIGVVLSCGAVAGFRDLRKYNYVIKLEPNPETENQELRVTKFRRKYSEVK